MSFEASAWLLFLIIAIAIIEIALLKVNYKGRFKYGMFELSSVWSWFDKQHGIVAYLYCLLAFALKVFIIPSLFAILGFMAISILEFFNFSIPIELVLSSMFGMLIGILLLNVTMDRFSVKNFETCYRTCQHNRECAMIRSGKCIIPHVQHNGKSLLSLLKEKD